MKPDWKDAPEWANWLAMDTSGKWFWHENKPDLCGDAVWWIGAGRISLAGPPAFDFRLSLEPRP